MLKWLKRGVNNEKKNEDPNETTQSVSVPDEDANVVPIISTPLECDATTKCTNTTNSETNKRERENNNLKSDSSSTTSSRDGNLNSTSTTSTSSTSATDLTKNICTESEFCPFVSH